MFSASRSETVFTSKIRSDLAESLEIDTFKLRPLEVIFNRFPCLTTSHECPMMSISKGTQSSRDERELRPEAVKCLPRELTSRHLLGLVSEKILQVHKLGQ